MFKRYSKPQFLISCTSKNADRHGFHSSAIYRFIGTEIRRTNNIWHPIAGFTPLYGTGGYSSLEGECRLWISAFWIRMVVKAPHAFRYRLHPTHVGDHYALPPHPASSRGCS